MDIDLDDDAREQAFWVSLLFLGGMLDMCIYNQPLAHHINLLSHDPNSDSVVDSLDSMRVYPPSAVVDSEACALRYSRHIAMA